MSARPEGAIDLTAVADVLKPGDKFDVITFTDDGIEVKEGSVVQRTPDLGEALARTMGAYTRAAQQIVSSGELERTIAGRPYVPQRARPLTHQQRKAKAASKAQRRARKAHRRHRGKGKG